jgi:hypothetical protein
MELLCNHKLLPKIQTDKIEIALQLLMKEWAHTKSVSKRIVKWMMLCLKSPRIRTWQARREEQGNQEVHLKRVLKTMSKRKVEYRKWKKENWQESKSKMKTLRLVLTQTNRCILNSINLLSLKEQSKQKQELRNSCKTIKCLQTTLQNLKPLLFLHVTLSPKRGKTLLTTLTHNRLISNNLV